MLQDCSWLITEMLQDRSWLITEMLQDRSWLITEMLQDCPGPRRVVDEALDLAAPVTSVRELGTTTL